MEETIEMMEHWAVVGLPPHTVEVEMRIKVFENGEIMNLSKTMTMDDVKTAFKKAEEGYIDDDDVFVLTEKGKAWSEKYLDNPEE